VNREIIAKEIRLVGEDGEMKGVVTVAEALVMAEAAGLDLVEISPNSTPPVCKILNYGKYRYEVQKKAKEARKKQKVVVTKEIKLRPTIDTNDYNVKLRNVRRFIEDGDKVRVVLKYRGREIAHQEFGMKVLSQMEQDTADIAKIELAPRLEGKQVLMILVPK